MSGRDELYRRHQTSQYLPPMDTLRFSLSYSSVISLGRLSGLPMPWYEDESVLKRRIITCLNTAVTLFFLYKIVCTVYATGHNEKVEDTIFAASQVVFVSNGPILTAFYASWRRRFKSLTDNMDKLGDGIAGSGLAGSEHFRGLYVGDAGLICRFARIMATSTLVCPMTTCFSAPLAGVFDGTYGQRLSVPTHCAFEENNRAIFEIIMLTEFCGLALPALQKLTNEFVMLGLLKIQTAYFKFLQQALLDIKEIAIVDHERAQEKLVIWMGIHQASVRNAQDLVAFFSPIIVFYYLSLISVIAGSVFYQLNSTDNNIFQTAVIGLYMVITIVHLYVQCHMADELTNEGEKLAEAIYNVEWYKMDKNIKKCIQLVITMANKPIEIIAYKSPGFTLSKDSFVSYEECETKQFQDVDTFSEAEQFLLRERTFEKSQQFFMKSTVSAYMGFSKIIDSGNQ